MGVDAVRAAAQRVCRAPVNVAVGIVGRDLWEVRSSQGGTGLWSRVLFVAGASNE